jgi:hypothetical protein
LQSSTTSSCLFGKQPPNPRYVRHIKLSVLRDAPLFIWRLPAGANAEEFHPYTSRNLSLMPLQSWGFWRHDGSCKPLLSKDRH